MIPCMIDAMKFRDVETADIPGAFLQTNYDKGYIHMKMGGSNGDSTGVGIIKIFHIYIYNHERKCKYSEDKKAIHGTLEASLLF